jgi:hypothetical protein
MPQQKTKNLVASTLAALKTKWQLHEWSIGKKTNELKNTQSSQEDINNRYIKL